jgi:hypothetical protein
VPGFAYGLHPLPSEFTAADCLHGRAEVMPYPALGPVRGSSAYWSQAVRRVTGSGPGKMTGVTVVYLVQHGEKEPGPGDPGLTELGRMQVTRTGRWLGGLGVGALWTSPMRRARETAGCIASVTGLTVQADARLRERLNWDGSIPWEAFADLRARTADDRDLVPGAGSPHGRQPPGCRHSWPACAACPGPSRRSRTAGSELSCCATCSAMMPCLPVC